MARLGTQRWDIPPLPPADFFHLPTALGRCQFTASREARGQVSLDSPVTDLGQKPSLVSHQPHNFRISPSEKQAEWWHFPYKVVRFKEIPLAVCLSVCLFRLELKKGHVLTG